MTVIPSARAGLMRVSPDIPYLLRVLRDRRRLLAVTDVREFSGNADRKPERARWHCLVRQEGGPALKLSIGNNLRSVADASRRFGAQHPDVVPREIFFETIDDWTVWATEAVSGPLFETLDHDGRSAAAMLAALAVLDEEFRRAEVLSSPAAFDDEWIEFTEMILRTREWSPPEREFLVREALPRLRGQLRPQCTTRRWTNGDFISTNLCLAADRRPVIFDAEYAECTHFFPEDYVRFQRISPLCHRHPGLLGGWWRKPDAAWEVFFQLRQLTLEMVENSQSYVEVATGPRLAAIRHFGSSWLGTFPEGWPAPIVPPPYPGGEWAQLFWGEDREAFTETRSTRVPIKVGERQLAAFRVPGDFASWRLDPVGSARPFALRSLTAILHGSTIPIDLKTLRCVNTAVTTDADCIRLVPAGPDPQLHISVPPGAIGLVVELECAAELRPDDSGA